MVFDPKVYRDNRSGIGMPADDRATDSTSSWTVVSLLKGLYEKLANGTISVSAPVGGASAANQVTEIASLASIDGYVDGIEGLIGTATAQLTAGATAIAKAEDAASADADVGVPAMAVRKATPANTSGTDGDYEMLQMSAGRLWASVAVDTALPAGEAHIGAIGASTIIIGASSTITRPADTTAYASGDLVANSTTAGSVAALQFTTAARVSGGSGAIVGARIQKSTTSVTNAAFRLHLFDTIPTFTSAGDNSAISSVVQASGKGYLGYIDIVTMVQFSDVAWGTGAPDNSRGSVPFKATAQIIYGIVEARGAYTPGNAEVFTVAIMILQD